MSQVGRVLELCQIKVVADIYGYGLREFEKMQGLNVRCKPHKSFAVYLLIPIPRGRPGRAGKKAGLTVSLSGGTVEKELVPVYSYLGCCGHLPVNLLLLKLLLLKIIISDEVLVVNLILDYNCIIQRL